MITSDAAYPEPSLLIATLVTLPDASTTISTVRPVPDPLAVVETPVALPSVYPVPAAEIVPRVLTPDALALTTVIVSDAAYPEPVSYTHLRAHET